MKHPMIIKALKIAGVILALAALAAIILYTQLWNPHVDVFIQNDGRFPLTEAQKVEDFEYLYKILEQSFPYFKVKERQSGYDWLARKQEFIEKIRATKNDGEFYAAMNDILMLVQNGHTNLIEPGDEYEEYKRLYDGPHPWSQVYGNKKVSACYDYWKSVVEESQQTMIPIGFRYIEGNYYAVRNLTDPGKPTDHLGIPAGSQLTHVNGTEIDAYIQGLSTERILKFDYLRNKVKLNYFSIRASKEVELTLRLPSGAEQKKRVKPYRPENMGDSGQNLPEHLYSTEILEKDRIAYLRLPSLASFYVEKDRDGLRNFFEEIRNYRSLIIDIRGNGGGSTEYWMKNIVPLLAKTPLTTKNYVLFRDSDYLQPFIRQKLFFNYFGLKPLEELSFNRSNPGFYFEDNKGLYQEITYSINPQKPVGFKGRILLLVDDYVYSSAEAFAVFAKATGWAAIIGTRTGGDGIGFDPVPVALPNSGLLVRFPAEMGLNPDGSINEETATQPDIWVEQSYRDFIKRIEAEKSLSKALSAKESLPYDTILRKAVELASE